MQRFCWGAPTQHLDLHSRYFGRHTLAFLNDRGPLCLLHFATLVNLYIVS